MVRSKWFSLVLAIFVFAIAGCNSGGANKTSELVSIEVTPADPSIAINTGQQFTATGIYSDNSTMDLTSSAEWSSSDPTVAVVTTSAGTNVTPLAAAMKTSGTVYGIGEGTTTITASSGGKSGASTLKVKRAGLVSITVTPTDPAIAKGTSQQFTATGTFSDDTTQDLTATVTWTSSNTGVAAISNTAGSAGLATTVGTGATTITATWTSFTASTTLTVNPAPLVSLQVTPTNPSIAKGTTQPFTATGMFADNTTQNLTASVTWSSSDPSVATIGSNGSAISVGAGSAAITATLGSISGSTTLTVNPATLISISVTPDNAAIAKGTTQQFTATGIFSDDTSQNLTGSVIWSSSNTAVASVSNAPGTNGRAGTLATGSATITATFGGVSGSTLLTVNPATLVSLSVTPVDSNIAKGTKQQFTATGTYSDSTTQNLTAAVTWISSNTAVATISNAAGSNGLATSVAAGSTTIKATSGSVSASTTLTVNPATLVSLAVTPVDSSIAKGTKQQFTATGTYSDSTTQNLTAAVTWISSNTAVATISNAAGSNGLATSVAAGSTTIKATSDSVSSSTTLTVNPATLVSLAVTPANADISKGTTRQFEATGTYSDSTTQNLTAAVTWSSSNTAVATISNAAGSNGLATSIGMGSTTIKAATGSTSGTASLTVSDLFAALAWDAPTTNTDGSPLTDLGGYKIHYGTSSGNYTTTIDVSNKTSYTITNLSPGIYYFVVTAYNTGGVESDVSNEASKIIQ